MVNPFSEITEILKSAGIEEYIFETRQIVEFVSKKSFETASLHPLTDVQMLRCREIAQKRATHYPLQYIFGEWDFMGLSFKVNENVLIPRADTEVSVEKALELINENSKVLDLCCGSGCIGISLAKFASANVTCLDISEKAVEITKENAKLNGVDVDVVCADGLEYHKNINNLDLLISNPPYLTKEDMEGLQAEVKYEPALALYGGDDGLKFYREISAKYYNSLKNGGYIIFEIGATQGEAVSNMLKEKYKEIEIINDYAGLNRVVVAKKMRISKCVKNFPKD